MLGPVTLAKASKQQLHVLHPQGQRRAGRGQWEMIPMEGLSKRHKSERRGKKEGGEGEERIQELERGIRGVREARSLPAFEILWLI